MDHDDDDDGDDDDHHHEEEEAEERSEFLQVHMVVTTYCNTITLININIFIIFACKEMISEYRYTAY
jgi:hypothetical protein